MPRELPQGAYLQEISAHFNQLTIPRELRHGTALPVQQWAKVVVEQGKLSLFIAGPEKPELLDPATPGIVPPGSEFQLSAGREPLRFYLEYYHEAKLDDPAQLAAQLAG